MLSVKIKSNLKGKLIRKKKTGYKKCNVNKIMVEQVNKVLFIYLKNILVVFVDTSKL